jgi:hypothetical protein
MTKMRKSRKTKGGMNFFRSLFKTDPSVAIKKVEKSITEKKKELKELEDKLNILLNPPKKLNVAPAGVTQQNASQQTIPIVKQGVNVTPAGQPSSQLGMTPSGNQGSTINPSSQPLGTHIGGKKTRRKYKR